jgi:hypothetical protein
MTRSSESDPSSESPSPEPEPSRGLVDPRTIHPGPEGLFPDPVEVRPIGPDEGGPVDAASRSRPNEEEDHGTQ